VTLNWIIGASGSRGDPGRREVPDRDTRRGAEILRGAGSGLTDESEVPDPPLTRRSCRQASVHGAVRVRSPEPGAKRCGVVAEGAAG